MISRNKSIFDGLVASLENCSSDRIQEVLSWIKSKNEETHVEIIKAPLDSLEKWHFESDKIYHETGGFFSIEGIQVESHFHNNTWDQPIINQPEIGYLGIISKYFDKDLKFLIQAKIEPGNVNNVQLSPTLQATYSNFTKKHKGRGPLFLEHFECVEPSRIIVDRLYSEQGARFLKKRNRNVIILSEADIEIPENFIWLSLGEIKELMTHENVVNMDTRTVISSLDLSKFDLRGLRFHEETVFDSWIKNSLKKELARNDYLNLETRFRFQNLLNIKSIPLNELNDWRYVDGELQHNEKRYFKVIGANITISNREVSRWSQPLIEPVSTGICFLYMKKRDDTLMAACQAIVECGHRDTVEIGPTVQSSEFETLIELDEPRSRLVRSCLARPEGIYKKVLQSEEGGRFFREQNYNFIYIDKEEEPSVDLLKNIVWLSLKDLTSLNFYNSSLNIQLRSLLSLINHL